MTAEVAAGITYGAPSVTGRTGIIHGYRISPVAVDREGRTLQQWLCPRCGRDVDGNGTHLIHGAPCGDCREYLRLEEGDTTIYDRRRLRRMEAKGQAA